jgi:type IV secretory pathway TraG/TraD family ATPase VirD4
VLALGAAALTLRVVLRDVRYVRERDRGIAELAAQGGALPLGHDPKGLPVSIPRQALAAHGLILGATGAGKTTTLMRLLGDRIERGEPVVVIDLKGSPGFAAELRAAAHQAGRHFAQWTPDGGSHWNPLATGNATELKDKLMSTERFTEPHYRRAAERYLQLAIQVAQETSGGAPVSLAGVVRLLSPDRLAAAARTLPPVRAAQLREYVGSLTPDQHSAVRGLASRLAILTESHTGRFLEPTANGQNLDLRETLSGSGVALFSLNSSTYGSLASLLGTLVVQDLVAATGSRLADTGSAGGRAQATVAIDEFSAMGSDNLLALLARGREAGVGVLMATQELADLERAGRGFKDQVLGLTAVKIVHRQDVPDSALTVAQLAGTVRVWERTYQERDGRFGSRGYGGTSARQVERYRVDPELVRSLRTGEAVEIVKFPSASVSVVRVDPWLPTQSSPGSGSAGPGAGSAGAEAGSAGAGARSAGPEASSAGPGAGSAGSERSANSAAGPAHGIGSPVATLAGWYRSGKERPPAASVRGDSSRPAGRGSDRGPQPPAPGVTR